MGLFSSKEKCIVCNNKDGKIQIKNGYICKKCLSDCGIFLGNNIDIRNRVSQEIEKAIKLNDDSQEQIKSFNLTKKIGSFLFVDEERKQWMLSDSLQKRGEKILYNYDDVKGFELIEDGVVISKGGFGKRNYEEIQKNTSRTFINKIILKVYFSGRFKADLDINILNTEVNINSNIYKNMYKDIEELMNFFNITQEYKYVINNKNKDDVIEDVLVVEEILKLEMNYEKGNISTDEYERKKIKLLGF